MAMYETWCENVASYLQALCSVQEELLDLITKEQGLGEHLGSDSSDPAEHGLLARLKICQQRRGELLTAAGRLELPRDCLHAAVAELPGEDDRDRLNALLLQAVARRQQLHHASVASWVITQRSLVHVVQLLEILATGEPQSPTYGTGDGASRGGLLDSAA